MLLIDIGLLYWDVFVSILGLSFIIYGRKRPDPIAIITGLALGIYPYFIGSFWVSFGIGISIIALFVFLKRIVKI